jgi:hypothetical protein
MWIKGLESVTFNTYQIPLKPIFKQPMWVFNSLRKDTKFWGFIVLLNDIFALIQADVILWQDVFFRMLSILSNMLRYALMMVYGFYELCFYELMMK